MMSETQKKTEKFIGFSEVSNNFFSPQEDG